MNARRTPPPQRVSFSPANESATYKDLLFFEERLKANAANLRKRKSRYQLILAQLVLTILFLASEVFLQTQFMAIPCKLALRKAFPDSYGEDVSVQLHPYIAKGLLLVACTTLVLFFASGLYSEKIGYANSYVHHANRALRNFNMYLNVRHRPLRSRVLANPFSFLFRTEDGAGQTPPSPSPRTPPPEDRRRKRGTGVPIPPIPPSANPRGELIFSSRVDRAFREAYERYRAAFERKREEHQAAEAAAARSWRGARLWRWIGAVAPGRLPPSPQSRGHGPAHSAAAAASHRGRASDTESTASTPGSSRRSSPVPRLRGGGRGGSPSAIPSRLGTPENRTRVESFSFLLSGEQNFA